MSPNGQSEPYHRSIPDLNGLPRPVYGRFESLAYRAQTHRHSHPWVQVSYAIAGVLEIHTDAGRYVAPPQRAVWIPAGVMHQVSSSPQTEMRSLYLECFATQRVTESCQVLQVSPLLRELIDSFSRLPVEYESESAQGRLAQVLLDQLEAAPTVDLMLPLPHDIRLRELAQSLLKEPENQATLCQWSQQIGVSEKTLSRVFLRDTGLTFRAWRQRLRLFSALAPLEQKQRVTDVALNCGYDSVSAFIAAFRQQFGCTPSEFFLFDNQPRKKV